MERSIAIKLQSPDTRKRIELAIDRFGCRQAG
jgi:hypothetical protein